jgi:hypothetical protein
MDKELQAPCLKIKENNVEKYISESFLNEEGKITQTYE